MRRRLAAGLLAPHHRSLVEAVLAPEPELGPRYLRWRAGFDPEAPVDSGTYRLLPLLWTRVRDLPAAEPLEGRLRGIYRHSWVARQQLVRHVAPALGVLREAGVPLLLLKGAALTFREYPEAGARPMMDLDALVPYADRLRAREALVAAGWSVSSLARTQEVEAIGQVTVRRGEPPDLDLHWRAPGDLPPLDDRWLWRDTTWAELEGIPVQLPSPTTHLVVTLAHGLRGNRESPIRWVVDAARIIERDPAAIDWDEVVWLAERMRLRTRVTFGLDLLDELGVPVAPAAHRRRLADDSLLERWEYAVRARGRDHSSYVSYGLARYWGARREQPALVTAAGLLPFMGHWSVARARGVRRRAARGVRQGLSRS